MISFLEKIASVILAPILLIGSLLSPVAPVVQAPDIDDASVTQDYVDQRIAEIPAQQAPTFGASLDIPTVIALFETTLAEKISANATAMTLTGATDKDGNVLASSTYAFIIDEGTASEEFVIADCTGTTCTNMTRGVSVLTGTSTVTALKKEHRRGSSVKITDGPQLLILSRLATGQMGYPNPLKYKTNLATSTIAANGENLVNVNLLNDVAFNGAGVVSASEVIKGVSELATQVEMASSTVNGGSGPLVLQARYATSTAPTSGHYIPVTGNDGNLAEGFIPTTITQSMAFSGGVTVGGVAVASTTVDIFNASGTWTKPTSGTVAYIQAWGSGGGGGYGGNGSAEAGGGGGGGYAWRVIPLSSLGATETVTIAAPGTGGSGSGSAGSGGSAVFGSFLTAFGGGSGGSGNTGAGGGGGGGPLGGGTGGSGSAGSAGSPGAPLATAGGATTVAGVSALYGAGGGGDGAAGGSAYFGGAGGGGANSGGAGSGGTSTFGGAGGAGSISGTATAGTAPGGGGGATQTGTGGAGGAGRIIVTVF